MTDDVNGASNKDPLTMATSTTTLAGRIWPLFKRLCEQLNAHDMRRIWYRVSHVFHYQDVVLILLLGWGTIPFIRMMYGLWNSRRSSSTIVLPFTETRIYAVAFHIAEAVQLSLFIYLVDICLVVWKAHAEMDGDSSWRGSEDADQSTETLATPDYSMLFAKVLYTIWFAQVVAKFKHYMLMKYLGQKKKKDGLALLIDHLANAMIGGIATMVIIDILELSGLGIRSAFALGSAGTLAITLGTQTLVQHIVCGFTMNTSNRFYVGDVVKFGLGSSGTIITGTVLSLGWLETSIRGSDELIHTIPNAKLEGIPVSNLSRHERCQVKQVLRFHYHDVHKLPALLETMKQEIIDATTPYIVTDGSRPCRVVWTDYSASHLEVLVDVHFDGIKPIGTQYFDNRQTVLLAIQKAVDRHDMQFAVAQCCGSAT